MRFDFLQKPEVVKTDVVVKSLFQRVQFFIRKQDTVGQQTLAHLRAGHMAVVVPENSILTTTRKY